jgi:hypothetical protein
LKKLITLILLNIHLLNIGGQLALHQYLVYQSNKFFNEQTLKGFYNVNDLTEVKIPVNLPGIRDWGRFENISGQIQVGNSSYNYVKMKLTRNVMYLMCIPNYNTTRFADENVLRAKGLKDIPVQQKDHVPYGKITAQDNITISFIQFEFYCPIKKLQNNAVQPVQPLVYCNQDIPEQPPKLSC